MRRFITLIWAQECHGGIARPKKSLPLSTAPCSQPQEAEMIEPNDHTLIAWGLAHGFIECACSGATGDAAIRSVDFGIEFEWAKLDDFGLPILTPNLRKRLDDEWRKWSKAR